MKVINTYDYRNRYTSNNVISKPEDVYTLIKGVHNKAMNKGKVSNVVHGLVEEAIMIVSNSKLIVVTPIALKYDGVSNTIILKRTHMRNVIGINIVNPNKMMWSINTFDKALEDITYNDWIRLLSNIAVIDSNYVLLSCSKDSWLSLTDVKRDIAIVPFVDNMKLLDLSIVGIIDNLLNDRSLLLDVRHVIAEENSKDKVSS